MVEGGLIYQLKRNHEPPLRFRYHQCPWLYDDGSFYDDVYVCVYVTSDLKNLVVVIPVEA
jgi:hypothetical protein